MYPNAPARCASQCDIDLRFTVYGLELKVKFKKMSNSKFGGSRVKIELHEIWDSNTTKHWSKKLCATDWLHKGDDRIER